MGKTHERQIWAHYKKKFIIVASTSKRMDCFVRVSGLKDLPAEADL